MDYKYFYITAIIFAIILLIIKNLYYNFKHKNAYDNEDNDYINRSIDIENFEAFMNNEKDNFEVRYSDMITLMPVLPADSYLSFADNDITVSPYLSDYNNQLMFIENAKSIYNGIIGNNSPVKYGDTVYLRSLTNVTNYMGINEAGIPISTITKDSWSRFIIVPELDEYNYSNLDKLINQTTSGVVTNKYLDTYNDDRTTINSKVVKYGDNIHLMTRLNTYLEVDNLRGKLSTSRFPTVSNRFVICDKHGQGKNINWAIKSNLLQSSTDNGYNVELAIKNDYIHIHNEGHIHKKFSQTKVEPKPWFQVQLPYIINIKEISFKSTNLSDFDIVILDEDHNKILSKTFYNNETNIKWDNINISGKCVIIYRHKRSFLRIYDLKILGTIDNNKSADRGFNLMKDINIADLVKNNFDSYNPDDAYDKNMDLNTAERNKLYNVKTVNIPNNLLPITNHNMSILFSLNIKVLPTKPTLILSKGKFLNIYLDSNILKIYILNSNNVNNIQKYFVNTSLNSSLNKINYFAIVIDGGINLNTGWKKVRTIMPRNYYFINEKSKEVYKVVSAYIRSSEYITVNNDTIREFRYKGVATDDMRFPTLAVYMNGELINWYRLSFIPTITNESLVIVPYINVHKNGNINNANMNNNNANANMNADSIYNADLYDSDSNVNKDDELYLGKNKKGYNTAGFNSDVLSYNPIINSIETFDDGYGVLNKPISEGEYEGEYEGAYESDIHINSLHKANNQDKGRKDNISKFSSEYISNIHSSNLNMDQLNSKNKDNTNINILEAKYFNYSLALSDVLKYTRRPLKKVTQLLLKDWSTTSGATSFGYNDMPELYHNFYTLTLWFQSTNLSTNIDNDYKNFIISGFMRIFIDKNGYLNINNVNSKVIVNDYKWHYLAITENTTNGYKIYVDNKLIATGEDSLISMYNRTKKDYLESTRTCIMQDEFLFSNTLSENLHDNRIETNCKENDINKVGENCFTKWSNRINITNFVGNIKDLKISNYVLPTNEIFSAVVIKPDSKLYTMLDTLWSINQCNTSINKVPQKERWLNMLKFGQITGVEAEMSTLRGSSYCPYV